MRDFIHHVDNDKANVQDMADIGMPKSPNAASFAKYGEVPVNLSNGLTNVSIPIHTIGTKNVKVPISILPQNHS